MAGANGHQDVNLPVELHHVAGSALGLLYYKLFEMGKKPRFVRKTDWREANHLCDYWVYVELGDFAASRVVFGVTDSDAVNPVTHMWARGKECWRRQGVALLRAFIAEDLLPWSLLARLPATVKKDFHGDLYGGEYMTVAKDEAVFALSPPSTCHSPGWTFVMNGRRSCGWIPSTFLSFESRPTRAPPS